MPPQRQKKVPPRKGLPPCPVQPVTVWIPAWRYPSGCACWFSSCFNGWAVTVPTGENPYGIMCRKLFCFFRDAGADAYVLVMRRFLAQEKQNLCRHVGGGSGPAPVFGLIRHVTADITSDIGNELLYLPYMMAPLVVTVLLGPLLGMFATISICMLGGFSFCRSNILRKSRSNSGF